jgi:hypothetical protein
MASLQSTISWIFFATLARKFLELLGGRLEMENNNNCTYDIQVLNLRFRTRYHHYVLVYKFEELFRHVFMFC